MAASNVAQLVILFITALTFTYSLLRCPSKLNKTLHLRNLGFKLPPPRQEVRGPRRGRQDDGHAKRSTRHAGQHGHGRINEPSATMVLIITGFLGNRGNYDEEDVQESDEE